jgi:hypothetical protein
LIAIVGAGTIACSDSSIVGPQELSRLASATARWQARPFADYSFEIRTFCFCPPEIGQWTRVSVRSSVVVSAEAVEADPTFPVTTLSYWQPVDSLFANLHRAMSTGALSSFYRDIVVVYDVALGYPRKIEYVEKPNVADASATIEVRNVVPLN